MVPDRTKRRHSLLPWIAILISVNATFADEVFIVAGTGQAGYAGDGGPAEQALLDQPFGIKLGPDGSIYFCEVGSHVIRQIDPLGKISTVAGTGRKGFEEANVSANQALLNEPYEISFDNEGNLYFVEMMNHCIRKVDRQTALMSLVAGTGQPGFAGDGGPATIALFNRPHSIIIDDQNQLFVCDIGNHRIRQIDLATATIRTLAGNGQTNSNSEPHGLVSSSLNGPRAIDLDRDQNLVLALREGNQLLQIDRKTETITWLAGSGKKGWNADATAAKLADLSGPKAVAIARNGDVYFADTESHTIRVYRAVEKVVETIVGTGKAGSKFDRDPLLCQLDRPHGIAIDRQGDLWIGDSNNHRVLRIDREVVSEQ